MTQRQNEEKKRKATQGAENTLGMEEKSPTMPSVFNPSMHMIGRHTKSREVIDAAMRKNREKPLCLHSGAVSCVHGYRQHRIGFMYDERAVCKCRLKVRRFGCRGCHRTWSQDPHRAGIRPCARRNERLERTMGRQMMHGVSDNIWRPT